MTVFPVGHYAGARHPDGHHVVRVGMAQQTLTTEEFGVWVLAHGTIEVGKGNWTVDDVLTLAEQAGVAGAEPVAGRLVDAGALAIVDDPVKFAERYRSNSLLVGLGNTAAEPDRYRIGLPGSPPVAVLDLMSFELWQWGQLAPSLWHACEVRAKVAAGMGEPVAATDLVGELLGDLRVLLVNSCAYLDLARG
jgi:hypothetical protein